MAEDKSIKQLAEVDYALRNYDQMDVRASESYERVAALQNEEQQEQIRGIR